MSSFLLEPILPNLTKAGNSGEQLRDLWRLFTKVKDCTQGGRRLENLYWRLWFQSSSSGVSNKEQTKLSHLLQSWTAEDAFQKPSFSSVPASPANNIQQVDENRSEQVHEPKASETTSFAFQAAQPPSAAPVAATVAPQNPELVRAPSTVSINISRVNSTIKQQAAAPACITAPVRPQQSKPIQAFLKPAKVVVGFSMDTSPKNFSNPNKPQRMPGVTSPLPKQQQQQQQKQDSQPERILASVNVSSKVALKSQAQAQAQAPEQKKKFFVASSVESTSSNEHIPSYDDPPFEKMAMFSKQTPNLSQPQHPPDPGRASAASPFSRVEPMGSEERPSNLSTLIRAPKPISRMPGRLANFAPAAGHFYRSRIDTFEPQAPQFESESLRQGVQLDHKPLFNYHLGNDPLGANFGESPNVW